MVPARAAAGLQHLTCGRFVLGAGTGGKPAMNRALGIAERSIGDLASDWTTVRRTLAAPESCCPDIKFKVPARYRPPQLQLATTDLSKWEAIDGDADGWQTFVTDPASFVDADQRVCAIRGGPISVAVRLDAIVVQTDDAQNRCPPTWSGCLLDGATAAAGPHLA